MSASQLYTPAPTPTLRYLNPLGLWLNLWQRRELIWQFTMREVAGRYKGSYLGILWSVLNPLLMISVYTFVFGTVFHGRWGAQTDSQSHLEFALTLFCGLALFNVFGECLGRASGMIVAHPNYVKKVVFPLEILPVAMFGAALIHALISFSILIVAVALVMNTLSWNALLFPLVLVPLACLSLGTGWLLSALGVFLRDIGYAMSIVAQILIFMTPVFYPIDGLQQPFFRRMISLNPLSAIVENGRCLLLWGNRADKPCDWQWLLGVTIFSLVFMQIGYMFFMKSKKAFADVL